MPTGIKIRHHFGRRVEAPPLPQLPGLVRVAPWGRLVVATGIPWRVLAALSLDPTAIPASVAGIVKESIGPLAWREAGAARSAADRERLMLAAIERAQEADDIEPDDASPRRAA